MKEIFAELYNKVLTFFQVEKGENTKNIASNRLKLVLMHDRTKLDPLTLEKMRLEMIDVISRYVVIDKELLELNLAGEGDSIALMLNIPVVRAKTEEELEEQAKLDAEKEEESSETTETEEDKEDETSDVKESDEEETAVEASETEDIDTAEENEDKVINDDEKAETIEQEKETDETNKKESVADEIIEEKNNNSKSSNKQKNK
ncbi:MAG: cell division topological specificity factor MinE [Candidatus Gastranaerophilales bacterium]|nr:cell division topological specificity factor MinE [Candidatus Gastranaerophilales bacterium]